MQKSHKIRNLHNASTHQILYSPNIKKIVPKYYYIDRVYKINVLGLTSKGTSMYHKRNGRIGVHQIQMVLNFIWRILFLRVPLLVGVLLILQFIQKLSKTCEYIMNNMKNVYIFLSWAVPIREHAVPLLVFSPFIGTNRGTPVKIEKNIIKSFLTSIIIKFIVYFN